jgi:hypothetical protein
MASEQSDDGLEMVSARSPDGVWCFRDGALRSSTEVVIPPTIDFFERWTFARFLPGGELALAFESGQPWSDNGSYGDRYGGVQVLSHRRGTTGTEWRPVAIEHDYRRYDESFVPHDVVWHSRGVLGWLHQSELFVQVLSAPRGEVTWDLLPARDSDQGRAFSFELYGSWQTLALDDAGRLLTATDADGVEVIDLVLRRRARDNGEWRPLEVWPG